MNIDIPEKYVKKLVFQELNFGEHDYDFLREQDEELKSFTKNIIKQIIEEYKDKIELPEISKEELKQAVLDKMAERSIDNIMRNIR
jgi:predicted transcriptional regulator